MRMPRFYADLIERALSTYVQSFIGLVVVAWGTDVDLAVFASAAIAAVPAALSVVKSALAEKYRPGAVSPASLAKG